MFSIGNRVKMTLFGASHDNCVGVAIDGIPAGFEPDFPAIQALLDRRRASAAPASTPRAEADIPRIVSGLLNGKTIGAPLVALFENSNTRSADYNSEIPRPGHSDYPAFVKYQGKNDARGGGFFSGRMTVGMCFVGAIALQMLKKQGISVQAEANIPLDIEAARRDGDSVGGTISCKICGLPAGVGEPIFGSVEAVLSAAMFAIPAVKGIEFGTGFALAAMHGADANDQYFSENDKILYRTNHNGGVLGGITTGMPVEFRLVIKPTPSIGKPQQSVNLATGENETLVIQGRHDACIVPRAVPVVEAMAAFAVLNLMKG